MRVLAIVAHPDDETLGCGATLAKHVARGDDVGVLVLGMGVPFPASHSGLPNVATLSAKAEERERCARAAISQLGVRRVDFLRLADQRFDEMAMLDIIQAIENKVRLDPPEVVYTHHAADLNQDHRLTHRAVRTVFRPLRNGTPSALLAFEVPSSTEHIGAFRPNVFVDVGLMFSRKLRALERYPGEPKDAPHARSIESVTALATWRGSAAGVEKAEAFELIRGVA